MYTRTLKFSPHQLYNWLDSLQRIGTSVRGHQIAIPTVSQEGAHQYIQAAYAPTLYNLHV